MARRGTETSQTTRLSVVSRRHGLIDLNPVTRTTSKRSRPMYPGGLSCRAAPVAPTRVRLQRARRAPLSLALTGATRPAVPMNSIVTGLAACVSAFTGRAAAPQRAGCAWRNARPAAARATSSCRGLGRRCWSSSSKGTSSGRLSSAPCTTDRAKVA